MNDYMRKIIYLKKREQGIPVTGAGYIRMERKREYLFLSLVMTDGQMPEGSPVYAVYRQEGDWRRLFLGELDESAGQWETKIRLTSLPFSGIENQIDGVLAGTAGEYWAGELSDVRIPYNELWEEELQAQETEETIPFEPEKREPEQEEPEQEEPEQKEPELEEQEPEPEEREPERKPEEQKLPGAEMYPFDDDEMHWCRQIAPEDFSKLPASCWRLSNNSFLFQGYYNYRHLLYAGDGERCYIGVPGQYHRREQYLARQFGFPRFKGTRKKRVTMGDFGYWLQEVGGDGNDQR